MRIRQGDSTVILGIMERVAGGTASLARGTTHRCRQLVRENGMHELEAQSKDTPADHMLNARFRALFEQSPISTIIYAADGRPLQVNAAFSRLWGVTLADLAPDYRILSDPQLRERGVMPLVERAFNGEDVWLPPFRYDASSHAATGRWRWSEAFLYPTTDAQGNLVEVVLTQFDVTERVEAEQALRASEARYRSFMTLASEGIWRTAIDTPVPCDLPIDEQIERFAQGAYIAECNESMAEIQGYPNAAAMRGTPLRDVLMRSTGNQEGLRAFIRAGYRLTDVQAVVSNADGRRRTLLHNLVGILHDGMFIGVWGTTRDITPLQQAEALARSQVEALTRTIGHLVDTPRLDALLGHVLYEIIQQVDAAMGYVFLYDAATNTLDLHTSVRDGQVVRGALPDDPPLFHGPFPANLTPAIERLRSTRQVLLTGEEDSPFYWPGTWAWHRAQGNREVAALALLAGDQLVGVLGLTFRTKPPLTASDTQLIQTLGQQAALAIQLTGLADDARQVAVLEERTRLAREIHDTLAQGFTGIIVQLQTAAEVAASSPAAQQAHLTRAIDLARTSLAEARRSMRALRATALADTDIGGALLRLVQHLTAHSGLVANVAVKGVPIRLPAEAESQLLRIGQEAVMNTLKHAQAHHVQVELCFEPGLVRLLVEDDGVGFTPTHVRDERYGLLGMRERAQQLHGELTLQSVPGEGTTIMVVVPIASERPS
jgi:PAS domain S-box-containing protein